MLRASPNSSRFTMWRIRASKMEESLLSLTMLKGPISTALQVRLVAVKEVQTQSIDLARRVPWPPLSRDRKFQTSTWSTQRPKCSKCTLMSNNTREAVVQEPIKCHTPQPRSRWWFKMEALEPPWREYSSSKRAHILLKLITKATMEVQPHTKPPMTRTTSTLMLLFPHLSHISYH